MVLRRFLGKRENKEFLIDFLNELLRDREGVIVDLVYLKNEHLGASDLDRKAIFDLYCENERGEKFIVELQKAKQLYFKDRSVYYSTFPIQEQAKRGDWNYKLKNVYTIGILDFIFEEDRDANDKMIYKVKLSDIETKKIFYDKLTFIYVELPKFKKTADELENHFEKWLYILKNLHKLSELPERLKEKLFVKLFQLAEVSKFSEEERRSYQDSLKYYRDLKNSLDTAYSDGEYTGFVKGMEKGKKIGIEKGEKIGIEKGEKIGIEKGEKIGIEKGEKIGIEKGEKIGLQKGKREEKEKIARELKANGVDINVISKSTGLSAEEISSL